MGLRFAEVITKPDRKQITSGPDGNGCARLPGDWGKKKGPLWKQKAV
jgi:hypothetical protein